MVNPMRTGQLASIYSDRNSTVQDFELARKYFRLGRRNFITASLTELAEIRLISRQNTLLEATATAKGCSCQFAVRSKNGPWDNGGRCARWKRWSAQPKQSDSQATSRLLRTALKEAKPLVSKNQDIYLKGPPSYGEANQERAEGAFRTSCRFYQQAIQLVEDAKDKHRS